MRRAQLAEAVNYKRSIAVMVMVFMLFLHGCHSRQHSDSLSNLQTKKILFITSDYDPSLKLNVSAWAALISGSELQNQQLKINAALSPWNEKVVSKFSNTLFSTLQEKGYIIDQVSSEDRASIARKFDAEIEIRSYLTAGFVYKTLTSSTYVPFVMVLLDARYIESRIIYRQLFVATDRPFNPLMNNLPATTQYSIMDIASLRESPDAAIEAFSLLAAQLGLKFAADLSRKNDS